MGIDFIFIWKIGLSGYANSMKIFKSLQVDI